MTRNKDAYFNLYIDDFLGGVADLSAEERGVYITLICLMYDRDDGTMYDDDQRWAHRCNVSTRKYRLIKNKLLSEGKLIIVQKDTEPFLTNDRVFLTQKNRQTMKEKNANSGQIGGLKCAENKRKLNKINGSAVAPAKATAAINVAASNTISNKKKEYTSKRQSQFDEFWDDFFYKNGRAPALKVWMKIEGYDDALFAQILAGAKREAAARPGIIAKGLTPKMAQGWITDRRWEDEASKSGSADQLKTAAEWLKAYPPSSKFAADYVRRNFCADDVPEEIRKEYGL